MNVEGSFFHDAGAAGESHAATTAGGGSAGEELLKNAEGGSGARLARDARNMLRNIFRASRCAMLRGGSQGNPCPSGNVVEKLRICFAGTADCRAIQPRTEGIPRAVAQMPFCRFWGKRRVRIKDKVSGRLVRP